jgi:hypothetical protein
MARRLFGCAAAAAVVVLAAACDQTPPSAPTDAPAFGRAPSPYACVFTGNPSLSNSAGAYFRTTPDRKTASGFIAAMQDNLGTAAGKDAGYSLLALAGAASRDASRAGSIDVGEAMVKQAVNCMFNTNDATDFAGWPDDAQYDFSAALDAPHGGAFFVRGTTADAATAPAVGNVASLNTLTDPAGGNVSAIAPPGLAGATTWPDILAGKRTLVYGNPVTDGFDWKLIGRNTPFSPFAVVALCQGVHPGVDFLNADVVFQQSVGTLGVQQSEALCGTDPSTFAMSAGRRAGFALVGRIVAAADRWLSPEPLHAAAVVGTRTIGGSASGAKADEFTALNLPAVTLTFTTLPPRNVKVTSGRYSVTVDVTTPAPNPHPAGGVTVSLGTTTNNGTATAIYEITKDAPAGYTGCNPNDPGVVTPRRTTLGTVGPNGVTQATQAVWTGNLCFTKTGSLQIVASSVASGNPAAAIGSKISTSLNVKP